MFDGILTEVAGGLAVAAILAVVAYLYRRRKAARLRREQVEEAAWVQRQREEDFKRLFEEFRALSYNRRGAAVLPAKAERQAELEPGSEALQRLKDEGYIHSIPEDPKYYELSGKGWTWLKDRNSREVRR